MCIFNPVIRHLNGLFIRVVIRGVSVMYWLCVLCADTEIQEPTKILSDNDIGKTRWGMIVNRVMHCFTSCVDCRVCVASA